ncbi:hypothetical protein WG954_15240 [Lacibacter sp. H375]|uniref:hypothetical protein n=1 Tax=Lacibacter sp. H375 TaxID=3133424 RepID=UPI0030BC5E8C
MKQFLAILFSILFNATAFAQINYKDSTVQAIGYWDINEKQSYTITTDKFKIREGDTISKSQLTYDVDITIVDSTANSYVIEWKYNNYRVTGGELIRQKIDAVFQDLTIRFKTDEMGSFEDLLNWQEVRDHLKKTSTLLLQEFKNEPKLMEIMAEVGKVYNSKENIESIAINDIQQFYMFYGGKYIKGETTEANIQIPNIFGGKPFDADVVLYLDEINEKDGNYILRYEQTVDEKQLLAAVTEYVSKIAKTAGKTAPKDLGIKNLVNELEIGSRIHDYGWVIYSVSTKKVTAEGIENVEERVIEIKD